MKLDEIINQPAFDKDVERLAKIKQELTDILSNKSGIQAPDFDTAKRLRDEVELIRKRLVVQSSSPYSAHEYGKQVASILQLVDSILKK